MEENNLNNQVNGKSSNSKSLMLIMLLISLVLIGIVGYKFFVEKPKENGDGQSENNNKVYELNKFSDYSHQITQTLEDTMSYNNGYYFLVGYERLSGESSFTVFKNGSIVKDLSEDIRVAEGTDIYYSFEEDSNGYIGSRFIDYKNEGLSSKKYQFLDYVKDGIFIAKSNGKYGLIDKYGKELLDFKYDYISNPTTDRKYIEKNNVYLLVMNNNKGGVIDLNGKFIIPLEYDSYQYKYAGETVYAMQNLLIYKDGKYYFILKKNNKYYTLDTNNKIIIENNNEIEYSESINKLIVLNKTNGKTTSVDFYSLDGKLIKNLIVNNTWDFDNYYNNSGLEENYKTNSFILIRDKSSNNKIYLLDENLNVKEFDNLYYEEEPIPDGDGSLYQYLMNDEFYIIKKDNKFELHDFKTDKIIESNFTKVYYDKSWDVNSKITIILCKNDNKSCGLMGMDKKFITDFNYNYITNERDFAYLKNDNNYRLYSDYSYEFTCNENFDVETLIPGDRIGKYYRTSDNKLYSSNCKQLTDKKARNITTLDNGYTIVEIDNGVSDKYDYEVYDNNDNRITYNNTDNAQFVLYLGFANNKIFFLMDKGIYSIDIQK